MVKLKGIWQPLLLALVLGAGFGILWCMVGACFEPALESRKYEFLRFFPDGSALIINERSECRDLAGNSVDPSDKEAFLYGDFLPAGTAPPDPHFATSWDQRLLFYLENGHPMIYWYFVCDGEAHGTAYLVGYQWETKERIGFIGTEGFRAEPLPPAELFPFNGQGGNRFGGRFVSTNTLSGYTKHIFVLGKDDRVYQIDLRQRAVRVGLEKRGIRSLTANSSPVSEGKKKILLARTPEALLVLNDRLEVIREVALPVELREHALTWIELKSGQAVAEVIEPGPPLTVKMQYHLTWFDEAGRVSRKEAIILHGPDQEHLRLMVGALIPAPVLLSALVALERTMQWIPAARYSTWQAGFAQALELFWPSLLLALVVGFVLAWCCYRREARYAASRRARIFWTLFVFAFGLFGWIGYRYGRAWPTLAVCPHCGAAVPRDRSECAGCRAEFPLPAQKGSEVFA